MQETWRNARIFSKTKLTALEMIEGGLENIYCKISRVRTQQRYSASNHSYSPSVRPRNNSLGTLWRHLVCLPTCEQQKLHWPKPNIQLSWLPFCSISLIGSHLAQCVSYKKISRARRNQNQAKSHRRRLRCTVLVTRHSDVKKVASGTLAFRNNKQCIIKKMEFTYSPKKYGRKNAWSVSLRFVLLKISRSSKTQGQTFCYSELETVRWL